jgi:hypothetical protein
MSQSVIVTCTCPHSEQDRLYGQGKRIANRCLRDNSKEYDSARCTVCLKKHFIPQWAGK